jgi:hypothetical protein
MFPRLSLDLIVAVITNDIPVIPPTKQHGPTELQPYLSDLALRPIIYSPLYGSESLFAVFASSMLSNDTITLLQDLRELTILAVAGVEAPWAPKFSSNANCPFSHNSPSRHTNEFSLAIHNVVLLASTIYQRAVQCQPVPFSSPLNHSTVTLLHLAIARQSQSNTWGCFPGLMTWVLLTGLAASIDLPERTFFVMFVAKTALGAMQGWWDEFTASVLRFRQVQRRAESGLTAEGQDQDAETADAMYC